MIQPFMNTLVSLFTDHKLKKTHKLFQEEMVRKRMGMVRLPLFEFGRLLYLDGNLGVEVAERHERQRRDEQALRVLAEDHVGGVLRIFERKRVLCRNTKIDTLIKGT